MRLLWITDPHLNHVLLATWEWWVETILQQHPDGLLITGDISEGDELPFELRRLADAAQCPIYFVLGNHDFYHSGIGRTRRRVIELCRERPHLCYLTDTSAVQLTPHTYLVGDDGWGDGTCDDYEKSPVRMNDFHLIEDFRQVAPSQWREMIAEQGRQSAQRLSAKLGRLPKETERVLVLTHVPPFREACWYEGRTTDDWWAPFFVCGEVGKALADFTQANPQIQMTTLCGHTHHGGIADIADNHRVYTGAAQYGAPSIEAIAQLDGSILNVLISGEVKH